MSDQSILVADRYDGGYFAKLGPSIVTDSLSDTAVMQAGLGAAFTRTGKSRDKTGVGLRFDAFGAGHDVTRIAHMDPHRPYGPVDDLGQPDSGNWVFDAHTDWQGHILYGEYDHAGCTRCLARYQSTLWRGA